VAAASGEQGQDSIVLVIVHAYLSYELVIVSVPAPATPRRSLDQCGGPSMPRQNFRGSGICPKLASHSLA
jgi:hypothetical protein